VSAGAEIVSLAAPVADAALEQLAEVLADCVEGGASVSFMSPFPQHQALAFFRKVASSVAAGDTVLLAAKLDGRIVGTVQLGLDTPPNQPHRADIKKLLVHRMARGHGVGAALMAHVEQEARRHGRWLLVLEPCPVKTATAFICARAGRKPDWCRTTRCFPTAGCATPRSCGNGSTGSRRRSVHSHLAGLPAEHRLLAGDAPVIAGQRTAFAEGAVAGHHERDRIFSDRSADRA
jgi:GNAT superfamily N-acetyltransferase